MAFNRIDDVRINGKSQAFGAYIYAVDYNVGLVDKPTEVKVSFINESGEFLEPELSVNNPYKIEIGNIVSQNFFAIERVITRSSSGRILTVEFQDGSILLDRIFVVLNKRMAPADANIPGLIVVGHEVHPCDVNQDGVFDATDALELSLQQEDPCELRCPASQTNIEPIIESCLNKEMTELFDVKYNFQELLDAMMGIPSGPDPVDRPISFPADDGTTLTATMPSIPQVLNRQKSNKIKVAAIPKDINTAYTASYTGTLREVLHEWCADFGWSFFWENDSLNFIDTKQRPKVKPQKYSNLESTVDTRSLKGTVARGAISHYGEPGISAQVDCTDTKSILLHCMTLRDLFGEYYNPNWRAVSVVQNDLPVSHNSLLDPPIPASTDSPQSEEYLDTIQPLGVPIEYFEKSVVCSYFSETLRHLYNLYGYYGARDVVSCEALIGYNLDRLGQMKIVRVLSKTSVELASQELYSVITNSKKDVLKKEVMNAGEITDFISKGGYFILAYCDTDLLNKQYKIEQRLANDFMGQHWYRAYKAPYYGTQPQFTPNAQYFGALSTSVQDLPFAHFNHTYKSPIGQMVSSFVQKQIPTYRTYGFSGYINGGQRPVADNISTKLVRSIIYLKKNAVWNPLKDTKGSFQTALNFFEQKMFKSIQLEDLTVMRKFAPTVIKDEDLVKLKLFAVYPDDKSSPFVMTGEFVDAEDEHPMHAEAQQPLELATYGLLSTKCIKYTISGVQILTPTGASIRFRRDANKFTWDERRPIGLNAAISQSSNPSYKVFVSNTSKNRGFIPKTESIFISPPPSLNTLKAEYQIREINRGSLRYLNKLKKEDCTIDPELLQKEHEDFLQNLSFSVDNPYQSYEYKIFGIRLPSKIAIKDGLESLSVRIDEKGAFTTIGIGNSLFTPPSSSFLTRMLEFGPISQSDNNKRNII